MALAKESANATRQIRRRMELGHRRPMESIDNPAEFTIWANPDYLKGAQMTPSTICPYCEKQSELLTGAEVYPNRSDLASLRFWVCKPCKARVGCHKNDDLFRPLGTLANAECRKARMEAHKFFDPLWRGGQMSRTEAYEWLAKALNCPPEECHIGQFQVPACEAVIIAVREYWKEQL